MPAYLGKAGRLTAVGVRQGMGIDHARNTTIKTSAGGVRTVFESPKVNRVWQVEVPIAKPEAMAHLSALVYGFYGPAPYTFVDPWAQTTNLLTPQASILDEGTYTDLSTIVPGGGAFTADGVWAGRTVNIPDGGSAQLGMRVGPDVRFPVLPAVPVTGSLYATGTAAFAQLRFFDMDGNQVATHNSPTVSGALERCVATGTPAANAVEGELWVSATTQFTMPAVTWADSAAPWALGAGVAEVYVSGLSEAIQLAVTDGTRLGNASFTVLEV